MNVEFDMTQEDFLAFNLFHITHSPSARRSYLRARLVPALIWLLACLGLWYVADQGTPLETFLALSPLFGGVALYLAVFPWWYRWKIRRTVARMAGEGRNRGLFGRKSITISPENVTSTGEFGQTSNAWPAVEKVVGTPQYVFIFTSAVGAVVVPRGDFANEQAFEAFLTQASEYHSAVSEQ